MRCPQTETDTAAQRAAVARLSAKERECLDRWLGHATAKEIARDLGITHHAVEKRLKSARSKLGAQSSLEAARILARVKGYGGAVSGVPELPAAPADAYPGSHAVPRTGTSGPWRRLATVPGVILMSIMIAALIFSVAGGPVGAPQIPATEQRSTLSLFGSALLDIPFEERTFANLDVDSSGYVERSEMEGATVTVRKSDSSSTAPQKVRKPSLALADADRDGRISFDEYRRRLDEIRDSLS